MTIKNILSLIFITVTINLLSQTTFKGKVLNEEDLPAKDITITIEGTNLINKTDENGFFEIIDDIPLGENIVTATGIGYKIKYFTIKVEKNKNIFVERIKMKFTKDEKRRRWVQAKVLKEEERRMKRERKKIVSKLQKSTTVVTSDSKPSIENEIPKTPKVKETVTYDEDVSAIQIKYSKKLGVSVDDIFNEELYEYIDQWRGVPYLTGGNTKNGIDDVNFVKKTLKEVFDLTLEDTIDKIFNSKYTETFTDLKSLNEGDLIFFKGSGSKRNQIVHIAIYLTGNKFIHAIELLKKDVVNNGVRIGDLTNPFWKVRFASGGRRLYSE